MPDSLPAPLGHEPMLPRSAPSVAERADRALRQIGGDFLMTPRTADPTPPTAAPQTPTAAAASPSVPSAEAPKLTLVPPPAATAPPGDEGPAQGLTPVPAVPAPAATAVPTAPLIAVPATAAAPDLATHTAVAAVAAVATAWPATPATPASAPDPASVQASSPTTAAAEQPAALDPVAALPTLAQISRYALKRTLPQEGLGSLYEAWDPLLERSVAIKTLQFESNAKARASLDSMFLKEARGIAGLNHPYIGAVYDAGLAVQGVYFAMERLHGATLRARLQEGWKFGPAASCQLVRRMADALTYAHAHGVLHGDIKPATVFITQRGKPKLVDFGVARVMQRSALASQGAGPQGALVADPTAAALLQGGSPHYMAPEQLQGGKLDARSDVYSLGVVLYELLAGRLAFNGDTPEQVAIAVLTNHPAPAHLLRPGLSADLAAIATQAMARNPAERFASAADMAHALRRWFDTFKPATPTPPRSPSLHPPSAAVGGSKSATPAPALNLKPSARLPAAPPAPSRDEGPATRPMPPYAASPSSSSVSAQSPGGGLQLPAMPTSGTAEQPPGTLGATAGATAAPQDTRPFAEAAPPPLGGQTQTLAQAQTAALPPSRATAQIRFLAGLVVVLAALCGALVAFAALR